MRVAHLIRFAAAMSLTFTATAGIAIRRANTTQLQVPPTDNSPQDFESLRGGASATCHSFTINPRYFTLLYATCRDHLGFEKIGHLNLNLCLANSCGNLEGRARTIRGELLGKDLFD
ncbi:hypothetical protein CABS01_13091 [Colletotrichum abscissum]|uniref:Cyanovirin-N domain-containing protein n=1 Tax=Colletotrichum abscissum TaxID=1671311 RepID=A0A9Q0B5P1_9PEZI|nr:uncharacterized protein CABS01_13091 [Colletotrichum abscissum]KAI3556055.1 hypothetical protein CABS02_03764 [Colletotrichum abscissum]KAK1486958.1 hypothetical protein CABS01_13091 [Colletotrichum abscissum]